MKIPLRNPDEFNMDTEDLEYLDEAPSREVLNLLFQDMLNRESGKVAPDTIGADYFFIEGFITAEMEWEFPLIEKDFLLHCYSKLQEFEVQTWYGGNYVQDTSPKEAARKRVFTYIYNGAKSGDEYCVALIKYLYKIYHKKEYNQLKRFRKITVPEIMSLAEDETGAPTYESMGRIMGMCTFMGIEMEDKCSILYLLLEKHRKEWLEEAEEYYDDDFFDQDRFDQCVEQIEQWHKEAEKNDIRERYTTYWEEDAFIEKCLNHFGYPNDYVYRCVVRPRGTRVQLARTLEILKKLQPDKEFTFEDVQHYAQLYGLVEAITDISECFEEEMYHFFGEDIESKETPLFTAENVTGRAATKEPVKVNRKVATNVAPVSMGEAKAEDYLAEIADLRKRLNAQEQDNRHLRELNRSVKAAQEENEKMLADYQNEREELIALREFAYRSTKEYEELTENTVADMKKAISDKNIAIIGGHINWINKLSKQFPNWMFVHPDSYKTVDGKMLNGKERVYFFTDYMNHISYTKFVTAVRERNIPFGYLHSRNIENMIQQVYEDLIL